MITLCIMILAAAATLCIELSTRARWRSRTLPRLWSVIGVLWLLGPGSMAQAASFANTGSLATARWLHTATLLPDGRVFIAGGTNQGRALDSAELYDPATGAWTPTRSLFSPRESHTSVLLPGGQVLLVGGFSDDFLSSAELYDPATGTSTGTGSLHTAREIPTATLLPNGKVLVVGGFNGIILGSAELYDPATGTWTATGSLATARFFHTVTLLPNGKVLVVGGDGSSALASAELYDPATGKWTATGSLASARYRHTATMLPNGKVLVAGGNDGSSDLTSAELYDPTSGTWTTSSHSLTNQRNGHSASLLPNGTVLVAGGDHGNAIASAELYDPISDTWVTTGSLATAREIHTATLLPSGRVLLAGGIDININYLASAELYDPASGTWTATDNLATVREYHTATLLPNGQVLVAGGDNNGGMVGSAELYDTGTGKWQVTGSLVTARTEATATLLANGKVLVAGGYNGNFLASAELYDPATGKWTATGSLLFARYRHTATLLPNGKVLVAGGTVDLGSTFTSAELYDPVSGTWAEAGDLNVSRASHSATLLPNGKVLVAGGYNIVGGFNVVYLSSAELYDSGTGQWTMTGNATSSRGDHTATLLPTGNVLVAGGFNGAYLGNAEVYESASGTWTQTGSLTNVREQHTATLLPNGLVLVAGGDTDSSSPLGNMETYDPARGTWTAVGSLGHARYGHTATLMANGKVIATGGRNSSIELASAELYDLGLGFSSAWQPQISSASINLGGQLVLSGTGFTGISDASSGSDNNSATDYPVVKVQSLANEQSLFLASSPGANWSATAFTSVPVIGFPAGYALVTVFSNGIPSPSAIINPSPFPPQTIAVTGQSLTIAAGDTNPSTSDGSDFGSIALLDTHVSHRFIITNAGYMPLNLTGSPLIKISGPAAADYKVTDDPGPALAVNGGSTAFSITFDPSLPGQRAATVSIASNDPATPSFSFDITGFSMLPSKLAQTITFAPPATLYLGQSPYTLSATSSAGLPVTLSLVAPVPAGTTLAYNVLTSTATGTVKVQATSPASDNYAAAITVLKSIAVKAGPVALTLTNLHQMYDGRPKPIATLGGTGMPAITYKVGAAYVSDAPSAAGSYLVRAVAGTSIATGTLVIAQAPLYVTPDDQHKFAGQANPALTLQYSGFVNDETSAVITKAPVVTTTATAVSIAGLYPITASGGNALNYSFVCRPGTMVVDSFAAGYEALLVDASSLPVGKLVVSVPATSKTFTAKLYTATETTAVSFTGTLVTTGDQATATATTNVGVGKLAIPYIINFTLPTYGNFSANATRAAAPFGSSNDGQMLSTKAVLFAGAHTAVFEPATPMGTGIPAGAGWAAVSANATGVLSFAGQLGDGTAFTATLNPDVLSNPGYRLFVQPYVTARAQSFLGGVFALAPHPALANRRYLVQQAMTWSKAGLAADASYRAGFDPVSTTLMIDPWLPPAAATKTTTSISLSQRLGLSSPTFTVTHSDTGSSSQADLPTRLGLSMANTVSVLTPLANKTKWKTLAFLPRTGAFTGSFQVTDAVNNRSLIRPVTFSGVLRQPATAPDTLIGDGHYLLPPKTGTEMTAGEVMFQRP